MVVAYPIRRNRARGPNTRASLDQIAEGGFAEYFEPFSGKPMGSGEQSWTAAVVLDWLADDVHSAEIEAA